jgi:hypothetical protein
LTAKAAIAAMAPVRWATELIVLDKARIGKQPGAAAFRFGLDDRMDFHR